MKPNKRFAAVAAAALAMAGAATVAAPSASAFTGNLSLGCWVNGISTSVAAWPNTTNPAQNATINHTLNLNGSSGAATVAAGASIAIDYTYSQGPINGGPTATAVSQATFGVYTAGADTVFGTPDDVEVATVASSTNSATVNGGSTAAFPGASYTANYTAPGAGTYRVAVKNMNWNVTAFALDINCNGNTFGTSEATGPSGVQVPYAGTGLTVTGPNISVTGITGQAASVTGYARSGNTLNVGGGNWGANVAVGGFTTTVGGASATNTLSSGGAGGVVGGITVPAGATAGVTTIVVTQGANSSTTPITILGGRTISLTPAAGGAGTVVAVSGSNFNPTEAVTAQGQFPNPNGLCLLPSPAPQPPCLGAGNAVIGPFASGTNVQVSGTASATGTISLSVVISDPQTDRVSAIGSPPGAATGTFATFGFSSGQCTAYTGNLTGGPGCDTGQNVNAEVLPGTLAQAATVTGSNSDEGNIDLGTTPTALADADLTGDLNTVTVTDTRGGTYGWSLTANMGDLTGGTGSIPAANLVIDPSSTPTIGASAPGASDEVAQNFGSTVTLCVKDAQTGASGTTGGEWDVAGGVTLHGSRLPGCGHLRRHR